MLTSRSYFSNRLALNEVTNVNSEKRPDLMERFLPALEMGLMAKNCCSIDMKSIWLRQLTHTIVEAFQQWWCFDEEKSVVQIAAAHELGGMEEALKGGNAFAVVHAVAVFSGRTESTSICENVFGLSAGLLRVTR